MGWFRKSATEDSKKAINWRILKDLEGLDTWNDYSYQKPVVFFKHSIRCSISSMAKDRFERDWIYSDEDIIPVYLDLINHRDVSNRIAELYGIDHQSPQILVVRNGKCVHTSSHSAIDPERISLHLD